jgi:hypothetical protein
MWKRDDVASIQPLLHGGLDRAHQTRCTAKACAVRDRTELDSTAPHDAEADAITFETSRQLGHEGCGGSRELLLFQRDRSKPKDSLMATLGRFDMPPVLATELGFEPTDPPTEPGHERRLVDGRHDFHGEGAVQLPVYEDRLSEHSWGCGPHNSQEGLAERATLL